MKQGLIDMREHPLVITSGDEKNMNKCIFYNDGSLKPLQLANTIFDTSANLLLKLKTV